MKTLIVIPAFNEADNLESLIDDINSYGYEYIIINDNSTDNTSDFAREKHYHHLDLPINVGIAGVTRIGFMYAKENNYDCVVCIDGDGQHQPKYVHTLISEIEKGNDYVIGSRFIDSKKPFSMRSLGSNILSFLIRLKTGRIVKDPTSGMRALGKKVINDFSDDMNFYAEPDTVCYLLKKKYKVAEVSVEMSERKGGESYFHNPFKSIKYMFYEIMLLVLVR